MGWQPDSVGLRAWCLVGVRRARGVSIGAVDVSVGGRVQLKFEEDRGGRRSGEAQAARDVAAAQQATLQHGAKVLFKSHYYPQRGRQAVLADPDGAVFAVSRSAKQPSTR